MIGVRLLPKQTVTKRLKDAACTRLEDGDLPDHTYWKTKAGFHFFVPELGPDKMTPEHVLLEILADVARHSPPAPAPRLKVVK